MRFRSLKTMAVFMILINAFSIFAYNIDASSNGISINKTILGQNVYTLDYNSAFAKSYPVSQSLEQSYGSMIRGVAGGLVCDTYAWNDLVGYDTTVNGQWGYDTLDYLRWARDFDSELMLEVNARGVGNRAGTFASFQYTNTSILNLVDIAEKWVRYCNLTVHNYRQGDVIPSGMDSDIINGLQNGGWDPAGEFLLKADEPLTKKVKYWEIGNEPGVPINGSNLSPSEYLSRYKQLANAMIGIDNSILVGPCITTPSWEGPWLNAILGDAGARVDFIGYHPYPAGQNLRIDSGTDEQIAEDLRAIKSYQTATQASVVNTLVNYGRNPQTPLIASEWNPTSTDFSQKIRSMAHAIGCVEHIFTFAQLGLAGATYWSYINPVQDGTPTPVMLAFKELNQNMGDVLLDSFYDGDPDLSNLRLYVTKDSNTGKIVIWGLNFSETESKTLNLNLSGHSFVNSKITVKRLGNASGMDTGLRDRNDSDTGIKINWIYQDMTGSDLSDLTVKFNDAEITVVIIESVSMYPDLTVKGEMALLLNFEETSGFIAKNTAPFASNTSSEVTLNVGDGEYVNFSAAGNVSSASVDFGLAAKLNAAANSYLKVADCESLRPNLSGVGFMIECMVSSDSTYSGTVFSKSQSIGKYQYDLTFNSGVAVFTACDSGNKKITLYGQTVLSSGAWYHLAVQFNPVSRVWEMYINGVREAVSGAYSDWVMFDGGGDLYIGSREGNSSFFDGKIDRFLVSRGYYVYDASILENEVYNPGRWYKPYMLDNNTGLLMHFDETSGIVAYNAQTQSPDGEYIGTTATANLVSEAGLSSTGFGMAAVFDGIDNVITVPDAIGLRGHDPNDGLYGVSGNISNSGWCVELWVKPNQLADGKRLVSKYDSGKAGFPGSRQYDLHIKQVDDEFKVRFFSMRSDGVPLGSGYEGLVSSSSLIAGQWSHIAVQYDPTEDRWEMYINGRLDAFSGTYSAWIFNYEQPALQIGAYYTTNSGYSNYFNGLIDEVRISNSYYNFAYPEPQICGDTGTIYSPADFNLDCYVDLKDFAVVAAEWLQ